MISLDRDAFESGGIELGSKHKKSSMASEVAKELGVVE